MNTAAAAPAATTAPVTRTGHESQEDTMTTLATAAARLADVEARIADAMASDDEAFDADLAADHRDALAAVRRARAAAELAAQPAPEAAKWVVVGRRVATRRAVKWAGLATSRTDALAQARAKWAARGAVTVDQVGQALA